MYMIYFYDRNSHQANGVINSQSSLEILFLGSTYQFHFDLYYINSVLPFLISHLVLARLFLVANLVLQFVVYIKFLLL